MTADGFLTGSVLTLVLPVATVVLVGVWWVLVGRRRGI
jgi:hypothetical protein